MSIILITHDLGVVAQTCKRVAVMCGGYVVEEGTVEEIFSSSGTSLYTGTDRKHAAGGRYL